MTDRSDRFQPESKPRTITPGSVVDSPRATDTNAGRLASAAWRFARGLRPQGRAWEVEIGLDVANEPAGMVFDPSRATRFQLHIHADEWGYRFCHASLESWIRITDIPFVHGRDDHGLLGSTPPLKNLGAFLRGLEVAHRVTFQRQHGVIATAIPGAEPSIRSWLLTL